MAKNIPGVRPSKAASSNKKSATKQPTPIDIHGRENSVPENTTTTLVRPSPGYAEIEEEIRRKAYELYEERGRRDGFEQEDWTRAEAEVRTKYQREKSA